jgi:hypothetical protein
MDNRLLIYLPKEACFLVFQYNYSTFKECQFVFKKLKPLFHHVPSTTNACNLAPHPKATLEYLKPTPNKPNSNQDPLPTTTDTRGTSTSKGTKETKHNEERHKEIHYLGFTLHKKIHRFLMLPTTCNGPRFRAKQDFPQTTFLNENGFFGIVQKIEETKEQEEEMQKAKARWMIEAKGVRLNLVSIFSTKISIAWTTCLFFVFVSQMVESNFFLKLTI